jgi:predicted nucleic acid-binding protein
MIILEKTGLLHLLPKLFDVVITTPEIVAEYGAVTPDWIKVIAVRNKEAQADFAQIVDGGEASAIALAQEIKSNYLIIDDLQARKLAIKLGLNIIGTLGVLLRAKQLGLIESLKLVLDEVTKTNFRISGALIQQILKDAGE